jgi:hypothetical protein
MEAKNQEGQGQFWAVVPLMMVSFQKSPFYILGRSLAWACLKVVAKRKIIDR